jgi:phenylalanyl-tRNA synthetase beta chain
MLISRNWLQKYFDTDLPPAEDIAQKLLLHAFEIEGIEHNDVIDIDVLPNRAHDCLSHQGVAHELGALLSLEVKDPYMVFQGGSTVVEVNIENTNKCRRYAAFQVNNVQVKESPQGLREALESIGQKSINNIVDATNYVMFDIGQPLHAFDADKVVGAITIRDAKDGETMTALSGEGLELTSDDLVIADEEGVLALAGVKGGMKAEVTSDTKSIIVEIANFDPISTRKTSRRVKIQTDSSKRFENELSPMLVPYAAGAIAQKIAELSEGCDIGELIDINPAGEAKEHIVSLELDHINRVLGTNLKMNAVVDLFEQRDYVVSTEGNSLAVTIPFRRLDLNIAEDLIEEVGRWYGYHNIPSADISSVESQPQVDQLTYTINKIKNLLIDQGYSEVLTYAFVKKGDVSVYNPIASDKQYLRTTISKQLATSLEMNLKNASYYGADRIQLFEIGRVYTKEGEDTRVCITCANVSKKAKKQFGTEEEQLKDLEELLSKELGIAEVKYEGGVMSFSLADVKIDTDSYGDVFDASSYGEGSTFKHISVYPYSGRDVSVWVDEGVSSDDVRTLIEEYAGPFLKKLYLFDEFSKEGRTSFAFSLIFQSDERTLEDTDIDGAMETIYTEMKNKAWEVR